MKITLVTNRTLKRENERLRLENRSVIERSSILVADNTALKNRNHNLKQVVDELLKDKGILADKICKKINYEITNHYERAIIGSSFKNVVMEA